ncbi:MAG: rRNA maturation RNase YbeY [Chitinophagales bacterium]
MEPSTAEINIFFHTEPPLAFELVPTKEHNYRQWLSDVITTEGYELLELNYIFCSDEHLHEMNMQYLQHDTLTDVITFDNSDEECHIEGDIFISVPRIEENAEKFGVRFLEELKRVMVHGLLHLIGYGDKTESEQSVMREKEDYYLKEGVDK